MYLNLFIAPASKEELPEILALQKESYVQEAEIYHNFNIQPLTQDLKSLENEWEKGLILKAEIESKLIGSVRAEMVSGICTIGKLIVKPGFQNKGIGKQLMSAIEKEFSNCKYYELFTGNKSEKNLAVYKKLGYQSVRAEKIDDSLSLIYLTKTNNKTKN
jgi:ribosomal protein S18 acetylase RimI-like enzyme